jgi:hypothetical protein
MNSERIYGNLKIARAIEPNEFRTTVGSPHIYRLPGILFIAKPDS